MPHRACRLWWLKGVGMPKILVADDSIAVRKVAERLLTEAGLGVTLAANGEEALAFLLGASRRHCVRCHHAR